MKRIKESMENFPVSKYAKAITYMFDLDYFLRNAKQIVDDFSTYGFCVLEDKGKLYGLMFKDTSGDDNDIYMKAHVYRFPQYGMIRGGVTFYPGTKNFGDELVKAIAQVR